MGKAVLFAYFLAICYLLPTTLFASTVSLSPVSLAVTEGQMITLNIAVDPQAGNQPGAGSQAYTAKIVLSFPAHLVSVTSFSQASGWLPLTQPGYDSVDNTGGTMTKTGGYAGGFSTPQVFGTVTFIAKTSGTATLSIGSGTQILDASNNNTFSGGNSASITIQAPPSFPTVAPVQTVSPNKSQTSPSRNLMTRPKPSPSTASTTVAAASSTTPPVEETEFADQLAQASGASRIPYNVIIPLLTFGIGFVLGRRTR